MRGSRRAVAYIVNVVVLSLLMASSAFAQQQTGGAGYESPQERKAKKAALAAKKAEQYRAAQRALAGTVGTILPDGTAVAPPQAPPQVHAAVMAANRIVGKPYKYGGGHGRWNDTGYDCSGSVSYALHGGGLLDSAMPSGSFTSWGDAGAGEWITIYANGGHMYMVVAGLRFDTSGRGRTGSRWQRDDRSPSGFAVRHPEGL
jgi:hypothetical protein